MDPMEILIDIRKIVRSINLESKKIQKDFGISIPQLLCLRYLSKQDNYQSTVSGLMKFLSLNSSTITGIINRLESKSLVARLPKMGDKRITYISLTSKGSKILKEAPEILHDQLSKKIKSLPDQKLQSIKESLDIIISAMGLEALDASPIVPIEDNLNLK